MQKEADLLDVECFWVVHKFSSIECRAVIPFGESMLRQRGMVLSTKIWVLCRNTKTVAASHVEPQLINQLVLVVISVFNPQ